MKIAAGMASAAALAAAAPAAAQSYGGYGYGSTPYAYGTSPYAYGYQNAYGYQTSSAAAQQCTAAVQNRLYNRTSMASILGSLIGLNTNNARVVGITSQTPTRNGMTVRGIATSGRVAYNNYGPYGVGAYGALGYNTAAAADLSFKCKVDYRGYVRSVDINRR
jgi:hypothetical protein